MPRYKLILEYDGTPFVGWQRQDNGPSVQAALERAIEKFSGEQVKTTAAGRTDAGVHALGQVVHLDLSREWPAATVANALNFHLQPDPIAVRSAEAAPADFHARQSARRRSYLYRILNRRAPAVLTRDRVWQVRAPLDAAAMHRAAQALVGHHDFTTFRSSTCQAKSPEKTLDVLDVMREDEEIRIVARARSFLHHQVRNMVGTLKLVGEGKWTGADVERALRQRDRTKGGPTAPACGLYFTEVEY